MDDKKNSENLTFCQIACKGVVTPEQKKYAESQFMSALFGDTARLKNTFFSPSRPEPIWFSPASVYVWLLNSQMSGEQKELQQPSSPSTHTCHNHGPTPHCPNNESACDRKKWTKKKTSVVNPCFKREKTTFTSHCTLWWKTTDKEAT